MVCLDENVSRFMPICMSCLHGKPNRAGQGRAGQGRAGQGRAVPGVGGGCSHRPPQQPGPAPPVLLRSAAAGLLQQAPPCLPCRPCPPVWLHPATASPHPWLHALHEQQEEGIQKLHHVLLLHGSSSTPLMGVVTCVLLHLSFSMSCS